MVARLRLSEEEWKQRLSPEEHWVLREHGTEHSWQGCFIGTKEPGTYVCAAGANPLFQSGEKFESGRAGRRLRNSRKPFLLRVQRIRLHDMLFDDAGRTTILPGSSFGSFNEVG